ncbi:MAG: ribonuclease E/G [Acidisphaera sp.]|nr:ribonuclease E/G [Acidisphaera sp.]
MTRILAASSPGQVRVAVMAGGVLQDYALWRPGAPDGVGDLHRGRLIARVPAMAGAFVALDGTEGFLPDSAGATGLTAGAMLGVRITRAAQGGKGPRLTARLDDAGRALAATADGRPRLLRRGAGALERLAAQYPSAPVLTDDPSLAARLGPALGERVSVARALFDETLAAELDGLAAPSVTLACGARLHIEPTRALTAIDIDAGSATADRRGKQAAQRALNEAVLPALARQIRLRNLSGAILVDLAGLARRRAALAPALVAALADDPLRPRLLGFTALGLAELVRARIHPALHELLAGPHAAGLAALQQAAAEIAAQPSRALALRAGPPIVAALQADSEALPDLARRAGRPLILRSDPAMAPGGWILETPA